MNAFFFEEYSLKPFYTEQQLFFVLKTLLLDYNTSETFICLRCCFRYSTAFFKSKFFYLSEPEIINQLKPILLQNKTPYTSEEIEKLDQWYHSTCEKPCHACKGIFQDAHVLKQIKSNCSFEAMNRAETVFSILPFKSHEQKYLSDINGQWCDPVLHKQDEQCYLKWFNYLSSQSKFPNINYCIKAETFPNYLKKFVKYFFPNFFKHSFGLKISTIGYRGTSSKVKDDDLKILEDLLEKDCKNLEPFSIEIQFLQKRPLEEEVTISEEEDLPFKKKQKLLEAKQKQQQSSSTPETISGLCYLCLKVYHDPIYFRGKYKKFERGLPHSAWIIQGEKKIETSVEEYLGNSLMQQLKAVKYNFMSAGREDIDVRMLGDGRPFIMTIEEPQIYLNQVQSSISQIQNQVNLDSHGSLEIHSLNATMDVAVVEHLQHSAEEKRKVYRCVIWTENVITDQIIQKLNQTIDLEIDQKTPVRVLHRRAQDTRKKIIHKMNFVEQINRHYCIVDITSGAGTYMKEFVNGDFGRTSPNFGELMGGLRAEMLQLDVMDVIL